MNDKPLKILLVEDNPGDVRLIREMLTEAGNDLFELEYADRLITGLRCLAEGDIDVILLDLGLPDSQRFDTFARVHAQAPEVPIILLTALDDEVLAMKAVRQGAQDYLIKGEVDSDLLSRTIRYAIERKRTEEALRASEEKYRVLVENANEAIIVAQDGMFKFANPKAVQITAYSKEELTSGSFVKFIYPDDQEMVMERHLKKLKGEELPHPYSFRIIDKEGNIKWLEINAVLITWEGRPAILNFLIDITERKKAQEKLRRSLKKLRKSLGAVIQAMALTVEMRDAYTAGHQRRMTDLARAIATEMQLSEHHIDGIRMAGTIHDIGKIGVPAEILNRPIHLTDIEFNLIKIHPLVGYNILKQIKFPWPVAKIVLQHHERMRTVPDIPMVYLGMLFCCKHGF